ncbi:MAG: HAMP domain-containing histidine kinase [Magnetococcus sp. YQC-5]
MSKKYIVEETIQNYCYEMVMTEQCENMVHAQLWGLMPGIVPYGIFFIATTFFLLSLLQIESLRGYVKQAKPNFNSKTRFFALFGSLMIVVLITSFGYAYYAKVGLYVAMDQWYPGAWFTVAFGVIPLSLLVPELLTSYAWCNIGLLIPYQANLRNDPFWSDYLYKAENHIRELSNKKQHRNIMLTDWLDSIFWKLILNLIYIISYPFFVIKNFKLNQQRLSAEKFFLQFLQGSLDFLMALFIILQAIAICMCLFSYFFKMQDNVVWVYEKWFLDVFKICFLLLMSVMLLLLLWGWSHQIIQPSKIRRKKMALMRDQKNKIDINKFRKKMITMLYETKLNFTIVFYLGLVASLVGAFIIDMFHHHLEKLAFDYNELMFINKIFLLNGGVAPIALIFLLIHLFYRFQEEAVSVWTQVGQNLSGRFPVNLADQALHQFNNLLSSPQNALVNCFAELQYTATETSPAPITLSAETRDFLLRRCNNALNMLHRSIEMVENLKTSGRMERQRPAWNHFHRLWNKFVDNLAVADGITIQTDKTGVPDEIMLFVDEQILQDSLINLFNNAVDAVSIKNAELKMIHLKAQFAQGSTYPLRIIVSDNGIGVDKKEQRFIFDPYFTSKTKGSGLGLYMVKEYMRSMDGRLSLIDSLYHGGASFAMDFPMECVSRGKQACPSS